MARLPDPDGGTVNPHYFSLRLVRLLLFLKKTSLKRFFFTKVWMCLFNWK